MYIVNLSMVEGCDSIVMLNLMVIFCVFEFIISFMVNDCQGGSNGFIFFMMMIGMFLYIYMWLGGSGIIDVNNIVEFLSGVVVGFYQIVVMDVNDF